MAVTSKANDSRCSSRVDLAVRKTSLVALWIAPVCLVRVVPFIACWFLASRKQLVGRLAAHSLDLDPSFVPFDVSFVFLESGLDSSRISHLNGHVQQSWTPLELNYRMAFGMDLSFLDSRSRFGNLDNSWPTGSDHFGCHFCFIVYLFCYHVHRDFPSWLTLFSL